MKARWTLSWSEGSVCESGANTLKLVRLLSQTEQNTEHHLKRQRRKYRVHWLGKYPKRCFVRFGLYTPVSELGTAMRMCMRIDTHIRIYLRIFAHYTAHHSAFAASTWPSLVRTSPQDIIRSPGLQNN